jgi:hypothetical protein
MGLAIDTVTNVALASYKGHDIPELGVAQDALDNENDVHFGVNLPVEDKGGIGLKKLDDRFLYLDFTANCYGPRMFDVAKRGGTVAEDLWSRSVSKSFNDQLTGFLSFFDEFAQQKPINKVAFRSDAKRVFPKTLGSTDLIAEEGLGERQKYQPLSTHKTRNACVEKDQLGTRWSKTALEMVIQGKFGKGTGKIHFHLDGMGDIYQLVETRDAKTDENVTSRELRYLKRNWSRKEVPDRVVFYNGYTAKYEAVIVKCPWQ